MVILILILFLIASFFSYCMCVVVKRADEDMERCMKEFILAQSKNSIDLKE